MYSGDLREVELQEGARVAEVLEAVGLRREEVVAKVGNRIVSEEEVLRDGDVVELIRVISGG